MAKAQGAGFFFFEKNDEKGIFLQEFYFRFFLSKAIGVYNKPNDERKKKSLLEAKSFNLC